MIENKVTDYGEEYNRESMYETARELLMEGKNVKMSGKRHKSLFSVMIEDCIKEQKKHEKYLEQCEMYQQAKDDKNAFSCLSKSISTGKVTDKLIARLEKAIYDAKMMKQYNNYIDNAVKALKPARKMSIQELNDALDLLKEYESVLLFKLNGDCITKVTYKMYSITKNYMQEIEDELKKRQANVSL